LELLSKRLNKPRVNFRQITLLEVYTRHLTFCSQWHMHICSVCGQSASENTFCHRNNQPTVVPVAFSATLQEGSKAKHVP